MKFIKLFLPFIIIAAVWGHLQYLFALVTKQPVITYNEQLEGSRILFSRAGLLSGEYPDGYEILFVGTSRTMTDISPTTVSEFLYRRKVVAQQPTGYNLGNVGYPSRIFQKNIEALKNPPKLIVIEFIPHKFLGKIPEKSDSIGIYRKYNNFIKIKEMELAGWVKKVLFLEHGIYLEPWLIRKLLNSRYREKLKLTDIYYGFQGHFGKGEKMMPDGQVLTYVHLPDRNAAKALRKMKKTDYNRYKGHLTQSFNPKEWDDFKTLIRSLKRKMQIVVLRAPIDDALYRLENTSQPELILKIENFLNSEKTPYIDMNPNSYYSFDMSHTDWYDTKMMSQDLAELLIPTVNWNLFNRRKKKNTLETE